uniref:Uncharacterized protein n=1 Tax=Anas zonorhyncha TaxID=75864 RepID=A0A8B9U775_9AVES
RCGARAGPSPAGDEGQCDSGIESLRSLPGGRDAPAGVEPPVPSEEPPEEKRPGEEPPAEERLDSSYGSGALPEALPRLPPACGTEEPPPVAKGLSRRQLEALNFVSEDGTCTAANEFVNAPCGICSEHWLGAWQRASLARARPPTLPSRRRDGAGCCRPTRSSPAWYFTLCPGCNTTASVPAGRATGILGRPAEIPWQKSSPGLTRRQCSSADAAVWGHGSGLCCQGAEPAACQTCSARAKLTQACH